MTSLALGDAMDMRAVLQQFRDWAEAGFLEVASARNYHLERLLHSGPEITQAVRQYIYREAQGKCWRITRTMLQFRSDANEITVICYFKLGTRKTDAMVPVGLRFSVDKPPFAALP
jgi:hypothetical protein